MPDEAEHEVHQLVWQSRMLDNVLNLVKIAEDTLHVIIGDFASNSDRFIVIPVEPVSNTLGAVFSYILLPTRRSQ